jgi:hypothetical protein
MKATKIHCPKCSNLMLKVSNTITCTNESCVLYETFFPLHKTVDNYNTCDNPLIHNNTTYSEEEIKKASTLDTIYMLTGL